MDELKSADGSSPELIGFFRVLSHFLNLYNRSSDVQVYEVGLESTRYVWLPTFNQS